MTDEDDDQAQAVLIGLGGGRRCYLCGAVCVVMFGRLFHCQECSVHWCPVVLSNPSHVASLKSGETLKLDITLTIA